MIVDIMAEAGHHEALLGLSLSFGVSERFLDGSKDMHKIGVNLANRDGGYSGEGKFLESIAVWLDIKAPRYWWQQFDTYRVGVTKQSESTMHTVTKRELTQDDFEGGLDALWLVDLNEKIDEKDFLWVKAHLPESFLQRRIVCTNYKALKHICQQREGHRLVEWGQFIHACTTQLAHPEYLSG